MTKMDPRRLALALAAPVAATLLGMAIDRAGQPIATISIVYLVAVLVMARHGGRPLAIAASLACFLAFNFFFTEPRYTLVIADPQHVLTVGLFLVAALIVSNLTARLTQEMESSRRAERRLANLYDFASRASAAATLDDVVWAVVHHVAATTGGTALVLLAKDGELVIAAAYPPEDRLDPVSWSAARWSWDNGRPAGRGQGVLPGADWLFLPMRTQAGPVGLLGTRIAKAPVGSATLLDALADQAAVAIERTTLAAQVRDAVLAAERERLRAALLSSLSHDLRTPLASILGASSALTSLDGLLQPGARRELAASVEAEAGRLNRYVQNLLDMTRIEAGALSLNRDWVDLGDILDNARNRFLAVYPGHPLHLDTPADRILLSGDAILLEQALFNLLDNAGKHGPEQGQVTLSAGTEGGRVWIAVDDQGVGVPSSRRRDIFEMFGRGDEGRAPGFGLGLAICKAVFELHGGTVEVGDGPDGQGCRFLVGLPLPDAPVPPEEAS